MVRFRTKLMHTTSETNTVELLNPKVQIYNFNFQKFPVDCDACPQELSNIYIDLKVTHFLKTDVTSFRS